MIRFLTVALAGLALAVAVVAPARSRAAPPQPAYVSGTIVNGAIAKASGAQSFTTGDLSGDCTTSASLVTTCDHLHGVLWSAYALLASPAFSGAPTAPNAASNLDNTTQIATDHWVQSQLFLGSVFGVGGVDLLMTSGRLWNGTAGEWDALVNGDATATGNHTLTLKLDNADRALELGGDLTVPSAATVSGTNTGDQTITLTGDVSGSGAGSFAATLAAVGSAGSCVLCDATFDAKGRETAQASGTAANIGALLANAGASHKFFSALSSAGAFALTQPACGDLSDSGTACLLNSGTSGGTLALNNGANVESGLWLFNAGAQCTPEATPATNECGYLGIPALNSTHTSNYTLVMTDAGTTVDMNCSTACTATIPPNTSVAFPLGTTADIDCRGAGVVTITRGAAVTLNPVNSTTSQDVACYQGGSYPIKKQLTDTWELFGQVAVGVVPAPGGRLSLSSGAPVMIANVTGGTTVYYDCYAGKLVPIYNGSTDLSLPIGSCEISDALPASSTGVVNNADLFDEWAISVSGTLTLCHATNGSGGGWGSDTGGSATARGSGYSQLEMTRGYWTNKNALSHCYAGSTDKGSISADQATYLGTFYTTAAGQTSQQFDIAAASGGSNPILGLFNAYNRVLVTAREQDTSSWSDGSVGTWRVQHGNSANAVRWVDGLAQIGVDAHIQDIFQNPGATGQCQIGINVDSTSATPVAYSYGGISNNIEHVSSLMNSKPLMGLHVVYGMEIANGSACNFWGAGYQALELVIND